MITPEDLQTQTAYDLIVSNSVHELFDALMTEIKTLTTRIETLENR
jgi:hypothetical protein